MPTRNTWDATICPSGKTQLLHSVLSAAVWNWVELDRKMGRHVHGQQVTAAITAIDPSELVSFF